MIDSIGDPDPRIHIDRLILQPEKKADPVEFNPSLDVPEAAWVGLDQQLEQWVDRKNWGKLLPYVANLAALNPSRFSIGRYSQISDEREQAITQAVKPRLEIDRADAFAGIEAIWPHSADAEFFKATFEPIHMYLTDCNANSYYERFYKAAAKAKVIYTELMDLSTIPDEVIEDLDRTLEIYQDSRSTVVDCIQVFEGALAIRLLSSKGEKPPKLNELYWTQAREALSLLAHEHKFDDYAKLALNMAIMAAPTVRIIDHHLVLDFDTYSEVDANTPPVRRAF